MSATTSLGRRFTRWMKGAGECQQLTGVRWGPKHILLRLLLLRHGHADSCLLQETRVDSWHLAILVRLASWLRSIIRHARLEGRGEECSACKRRRTSMMRVLSHLFGCSATVGSSLFSGADTRTHL